VEPVPAKAAEAKADGIGDDEGAVGVGEAPEDAPALEVAAWRMWNDELTKAGQPGVAYALWLQAFYSSDHINTAPCLCGTDDEDFEEKEEEEGSSVEDGEAGSLSPGGKRRALAADDDDISDMDDSEPKGSGGSAFKWSDGPKGNGPH
jgi:hypothetical protein